MFGRKVRDAAFFNAFSAHAAKSVEAAKMLAEMVGRMKAADPSADGAYHAVDVSNMREVDEETKRLYARIKATESAADTITHETVKRLHENWITPLDRDDIHGLVTRMDDVVDLIEEVAERIVLFQVSIAPPEAESLVALLVESCETLVKAMVLLPTMARAPEILELCVEVNRLENAADSVHRKAMADLFKPGNDPLMVMKWRDIFDSMEAATDRCEDVANIVEGVVLEYA